MESDLSVIKERLRNQDCAVALRHFEQAENALGESAWESANAQIRSALESLFNRVAEIRLGTSKRGGAARKELEARGILSPKKGRFIQSFMDLAGESGSHAGASSSEESRGKFLAAVGLMYIGLDLIPDVVTVEAVLGRLDPPPKDDQISTVCRTCGVSQRLSECESWRDGEDTVYVCKNGCQTLVVIGKPGDSPWAGRGYRLGNHVIRNAGDLEIHVSDASVVVMPASPAALMKKRPTD
jgi:hypothetical protein